MIRLLLRDKSKEYRLFLEGADLKHILDNTDLAAYEWFEASVLGYAKNGQMKAIRDLYASR